MRIMEKIWIVNEQRLDPLRRWLLRVVKRISIAVECIIRNNITTYASALTYSSALAAVPILAIIFAVARGFGFETMIEERLRESLQVNPGLADEVINFVQSYLQHTKGGVFIGVGLIFLLYTLIALTSNIETAFNTIWHVPRSREIHRQVMNYISVFFLLPFIMIIGSGISFFLQTFRQLLPEFELLNSTLMHIIQVTPWLLTCFVFVLLYKLMPNTKVRMSSALWTGILAGACFIIVQYLYVHYQIKLSSYNAIYGSFAAIPLFMLWLQISWCICLIGGQLTYADQTLEHYAFERNFDSMSRRYRDTITLLLLCRICKRFAVGSVPYTYLTLAKDCDLPDRLVDTILRELADMQLLAQTGNGAEGTIYYLPAIDIHRMTLQMVLRRIDSYGNETTSHHWQASTKEWTLLRKLRNEGQNELLINI